MHAMATIMNGTHHPNCIHKPRSATALLIAKLLHIECAGDRTWVYHMPMCVRPLVLSVVLACISPLICSADTLAGRVVAVADGDTITVLDSANEQHKVRVGGIDAPEKKQAFGDRSKQSMTRLAFGKPVRVAWSKKDRYGRIVGKVWAPQEDCQRDACPKTLDVGLAQIALGLAWHYKKYEREQEPADRVTYAKAETQAQARKIALWSDPLPIAPWDYRHRKKNGILR